MADFNTYLELCREVEKLAASIYRTLGERFPEHAEFFGMLETEEERHAYIFSVGGAFHRIGKTPENLVPASMQRIEESIASARGVQNSLDAGTCTLEQALDLAVVLENTHVESYLEELMSRVHDSGALEKLRLIYNETKTHSEKLVEFRKKL